MSVFLPQSFIRCVRDGQMPAHGDIETFIKGIATNDTTDAHIAAFAMALFHHDFEMAERIILTQCVIESGETLMWDLPGPVLDKHSTGGVGDNVSLILGPLAAACGGYVPMISGRGLGHTGGTLDKFDAIPGYNTRPENAVFKRVVRDVGCAIIGQTGTLAPADARIYSVRSATATVKCVSLITASILSKKRAAGLDALVLDVKCGNGAVMQDTVEANTLASSLVNVGNGLGMKTTALLTDMNEPLASAAGNALEVRNAIAFLTGEQRDPRLLECVMQLSADMLVAGGLAKTTVEARTRLNKALSSGKALAVFAKMVSVLGGPKDFIENVNTYLTPAPIICDVLAPHAGTITYIDTRVVGNGVIVLGGGRKRIDDKIDYAVGFDQIAGVGKTVCKGDSIIRIHARDETTMRQARTMIEAAYSIGEGVKPAPVILERMS